VGVGACGCGWVWVWVWVWVGRWVFVRVWVSLCLDLELPCMAASLLSLHEHPGSEQVDVQHLKFSRLLLCYSVAPEFSTCGNPLFFFPMDSMPTDYTCCFFMLPACASALFSLTS